eukprot:TRINITY_DN619_c0_g1_i2.p3 TRINITY_DN619_c0_g1~~TRINITY_DN619_c0_g1_i2.p3  ORF type:complete len:215 (-),score=89.33 TRINITY_DN619_c0_g1_i2:65-709(-)
MALRQLAARAARPLCARTFASAAAAADHSPPLKLFGIPARYANATYTAASKAGKLDAVEADLTAFGAIITRNAEFSSYLSNPTVTRADKVALIESVFDGKHTTDISRNLFTTMAANARLSDARRVIGAFTELMKAKRGEVDAIVTTAEPLSAAQEKALIAALKKQVGDTAKIALETKVDAALIGGLTVQIGDKFMDLSIATKIKSVKNTLAGTV